ncbi:DNA polymerase III subunit delta [Persicitalea jodogahamensis]|uniref:DNA polymerase III subunit delta n=1 Tax=Persicitalea jodogahamensis TaxID=402147 RepID=A0A8J3DAF0_9BACT|nr:DNA polymerase III subunit delta [Persicitalea jodogahamensis]GHB82128.1 DNA polymerase III subunit delta [Persicitalea jodogahamensis]
MAQTPESVLKEIRAKQFKPVYFLYGDEPYYIDLIAEELEKRVVPAAEKGFNQFVIYGKDTDMAGALGYAKRYPFMAERQLVWVKDAHHLSGIKEKEQLQRLEDYALNPLTSTVLVLCYHDKADERKSFIKACGKSGAVVHSKRLYDNKLPEWVRNYCHAQGIKISPKAEQMLVTNIGNDLKRIVSEIQKVVINLKAGEGVDADAIERFVGISKEYNVFEFQKALGQRDVLKANNIAHHFAANPKDNPLAPILIILFSFFTKVMLTHAATDRSDGGLASLLGVNPFFVKDYTLAARNYSMGKVAKIIHDLRYADAQMKGVDAGSVDDGELLKQLVFEIIH